jgi:hypothetical protein
MGNWVVSNSTSINFSGIVANPADQQGTLQQKNIAEHSKVKHTQFAPTTLNFQLLTLHS